MIPSGEIQLVWVWCGLVQDLVSGGGGFETVLSGGDGRGRDGGDHLRFHDRFSSSNR